MAESSFDYRCLPMLEECFRWFGPEDPVPLSYIRQAGAAGVFSSLHQIPYGEAWPVEAIRQRKAMIESSGLRWSVVESVPVHEGIKCGVGDLGRWYENYAVSLRRLAAEGIHTVIYNFMPVLDWVRTDMRHRLPDGSECLLYDPVKFAAFEIHALQRSGAELDFSPEQVERAACWWGRLTDDERSAFIEDVIDVFPGCKLGLGLDDIRAMLAPYDGLGPEALSANLKSFLQEVLPVAEEVGIRLAIHPDDPPFPVLGLPRIVSTADQVREILGLVESPSNGLCFCSGSFGARPDNDLVAMAAEFASKTHAVHLRATSMREDGTFYEADHLGGDAVMPALLERFLAEQDRRQQSGVPGWQLPLRPDHGHTMMHDLTHYRPLTPGYSAIGRMRGLAELRGVMHGLRFVKFQAHLVQPGLR